MLQTLSNHKLVTIYLSNLLLSFHYFLILYIHSSYLGTFFNASGIALLYIVGSLVNLILFLNIPRILDRIGNYKFTLWAIILEAVAITGLIVGTSQLSIGLSFVLHQAVMSMMLFGLDIFLESATKNEDHTGAIRGLYLTLSNITLVFSPLIVGLLLTNDSFWKVYAVSLAFLFPLFFIIRKYLKDAKYKRKNTIHFIKTIKNQKNKSISAILYSHFMLQFFYAWMVIYMPIYLHQYIGFSWQEIGVIFTVMLLPFILFELPIGALADKKLGEKEILITGFFIMALSTFFIPMISSQSIMLWAGILFITRIGASFVEITSESYFFKHVNEENTGLISLFRMARPLAYISAPIMATATIYFFSTQNTEYGYIFSVLAIIMLVGVKHGLRIKDTK
jgi:MFS family permease